MTVPVSNMTATFANTTIRYDAIGMDVNASSYAANSTLINLKKNGNTKFSVDVSGIIFSNGVNINATLKSSFDKANSAYDIAFAGGGNSGEAIVSTNTYLQSLISTSNDTANAAFNKANAANVLAFQVSGAVTTANGVAVSAFNKANDAYDIAVSGGGEAGEAISSTNTYLQSVISQVQTISVSGFTQANTARNTANTALSVGQSAFTQANTARNTANTALNLREVVSVEEFGAVGDGIVDDTSAIQDALDYVQSGSSTEGPYRKLVAPAGKKYKTTSSLTITQPCIVEFLSMIEYASNTGSALIIGDSSSRNTGYDLTFTGFRHVVSSGGWSVPPTSAGAGANGVEVRNMQFSKLRVDKIIAFRSAGFFANCQGSGVLGFNAHVQQNDISLGEIGYCGWGVRTLSASAELSAFQANYFRIQDLITNYYNLEFDQSGGTYTNTTSNSVFLNACELAASGGSEIRVFGSYNTFQIGFLEGNFLAGNTSFYNTAKFGNNFSSGLSITDQGTRNWLQSGPPNDLVLPTTSTIVANTVIQNTFGVPVCLAYVASLNPNTTSELSVGFTSNPPVITKADNSDISANAIIGFPFFAVIPPNYYWRVSNTGIVSYSTASLYQASM